MLSLQFLHFVLTRELFDLNLSDHLPQIQAKVEVVKIQNPDFAYQICQKFQKLAEKNTYLISLLRTRI